VNPTYYSIGDHTETLQIDYDPKVTSYSDLLALFWKEYSPGKPWSTQYMSAIWYHDDEQKKLIEKTKSEKEKQMSGVHLLVAPLTKFYLAEDYHQKYYLQNSHWASKLNLPADAEELANSYLATRLNGYIKGSGSVEDLEADLKKLSGLIDEEVKQDLRENMNRGRRVKQCVA
jgi:peptide-methionine (S)-S-oxide reductase